MRDQFSYLGLRIVLDAIVMSDHAGWDFSRCRSPARAMRRWKRRGAGSKMVREIRRPKDHALQIGDMLIMHPAIWAKISASVPLRASARSA